MSEKKTIGKKRKHDEYCEEESDNMEISIRKKSDTRNRKKAKKSAPLADAAEDFALPDAAEDFAPLDDAAEDFAPLDDAAEDFAPLDAAAEDNALPAAAEDFALPDAAAEDFALPDADAAEDFAPPAAAAAPIGQINAGRKAIRACAGFAGSLIQEMEPGELLKEAMERFGTNSLFWAKARNFVVLSRREESVNWSREFLEKFWKAKPEELVEEKAGLNESEELLCRKMWACSFSSNDFTDFQ